MSCLEIPVTIPHVRKDPSKATTVKFRRSYIFETLLPTVGCPQATYEWRIHSAGKQPLTFHQNFTLVSRQPKWVMKRKSFLPGLYLVKVFVMFSDKTNYDYGFLRIIPSGLIARIDGGNEIKLSHGALIKLDASLSYNKDFGRGNHTGLNFTWYCTKNNESFTSNTDHQQVMVNGSACFENGTIKLLSNGMITYVDSQNMVAGLTYTFTLIVKSVHSSESCKQKVHLVSGERPLNVIR